MPYAAAGPLLPSACRLPPVTCAAGTVLGVGWWVLSYITLPRRHTATIPLRGEEKRRESHQLKEREGRRKRLEA